MLPPVIGMAPKRGILVDKDKVFLNIGAKLFAFDHQTGLVARGFGPNGVFSGGSPTAPFIFKQNIFIVSLDGYIRGFDIDSGDFIQTQIAWPKLLLWTPLCLFVFVLLM